MLIARPYRPMTAAIAALVVVELMLFAAPLRAQFDESATSVADAKVVQPKPEIKLSTTKLNFGSHKTGTVSKKSFTIKNRSKTDVLQGSIFLPTGPPFAILAGGGTFAISPKGKLVVTIQFAPSLTEGSFTEKLPITSSDPMNPSLTVTITAKATGKLF
jgi:Abnormal spindle-like microcephaly-assoc'd, ASPM-SPD-2-Hydin